MSGSDNRQTSEYVDNITMGYAWRMHMQETVTTTAKAGWEEHVTVERESPCFLVTSRIGMF